MKQIFTAADPVTLSLLAAYLESEGFHIFVRGLERQTLAGGVPPLECWPEILLLDEEREAEAQDAIQRFSESRAAVGTPWRCPNCSELIEGQFSDCWKCSAAR